MRGKINYWVFVNIIIMCTVTAWIIYIMKPVIDIAEYAHSTTDDYWMSFAVHNVWESTHSIFAALKEALHDAVILYRYHSGCFLSMFLTALSPVVFNEEYYKYAIYVVFFMLTVSVYFAAYVFLRKKLRLSVAATGLIGSIILFLMINYLPFPGEVLYWWPGAVNYTVFLGLFLFTQSFVMLYMMKSKVYLLVIASIFSFISCQGNLITALTGVCVLFTELIYIMIKGDKKLRIGFAVIFGVSVVSLLLSVLAPGNYVRGAGVIGKNNIFMTIILSVKHACILYADFNDNIGTVYYIFLAVAAFTAFISSDVKFNFRYPALFCVVSFLVYCSGLAPVIYSGVSYYARIYAIIYYNMVLTNSVCIVYLAGYLCSKVKEKGIISPEKVRHVPLMVIGICSIVMIVFSLTQQFGTNAFAARTYIGNGDAQRFDERIRGRFYAYYDENIRVVEFDYEDSAPSLFFFNDEDTMKQRAYYIMNGTKVVADYFYLQDEDAVFEELEYTNLLACYFGKDAVIMNK